MSVAIVQCHQLYSYIIQLLRFPYYTMYYVFLCRIRLACELSLCVLHLRVSSISGSGTDLLPPEDHRNEEGHFREVYS